MPDISQPPSVRSNHRRAKSGPTRLLLQWAISDYNPFLLVLLFIGCGVGAIYAQQEVLLFVSAAIGLAISNQTWARILAVIDLVLVRYATEGHFWKSLAWNDKTGDWVWRWEHGPVAVGVGFAAGVIVGTVFLWLFGTLAEPEETDEDDEPTESVVEATKPEADDPARTVDQAPAAATPIVYGDIGGHEILAEIGRGGMGVVFKARRRDTGRVVALKMTLAGAGAAQAVERFRTEAEAVAGVDHPGIVPVYEFGDHHGRPFFTMGFVDGPSLSARLASGPMEPAVAAYVVRQAAKAVAAAHGQGIIHRDLKPGNILLDRGGDTRVTDFGLARRVDAAATDDADAGPADEGADEHPDTMMTVQRLTATGAVMGTPAYMAPEQALDAKRVGPAADVWGLGAVLYACLTGRPPFHGSSMAETLTLVIEAEPRPLREVAPLVDGDLEAICLKCLRKDPAARYRTAAELAADLERREAGKTPLAARVGLFERVRRLEAAIPEALPILAGLAAARLASLQDSIFVAVAVAATFITARVPDPRALARGAVLWGALAVAWPIYSLTELDPFPEAARSNWVTTRDRLPPGYELERAEWDRFMAFQDAEAAERVNRFRVAVGVCLLTGVVAGLGFAVGARSAAPARLSAMFLYRLALYGAVIVCVLGLVFNEGGYAASRNLRAVMWALAAPAGWGLAAVAGMSAGAVISLAVRQVAGPTRAGAGRAASVARLAVAVTGVGLLWVAAVLAEPAAGNTFPVVEKLFGRSPLSSFVEHFAALGGWASDSLRPAGLLAKFVLLAVPMLVAGVTAAVLTRGRKFR